MITNRIELTDLPEWAQDKIIRTALGLLEDENAFAERMGRGFLIHAHGFVYHAFPFDPYVY